MRKPMLKMVLLIAFVLFTALSCDIFINTGGGPEDEIKDTWLLISVGGQNWIFNNQIYTFTGSLVVLQGVNSTVYTMNDSVIAIQTPALVGLAYPFNPLLNTYSVRFRDNFMYWDVPGGPNSYFIFQLL